VAPALSVVVPVYGNEATLPAVVERMAGLTARVPSLEVVFVVDGSPDASLLVLRRLLADGQPFVAQLIGLSRNFGSFSAIRAGLAAAEGQVLAVAAADLQEPPELLDAFYASLASGEHDIALGVRLSRADPLRSRMASGLFWRAYRRFIQREMPADGVDVFACTRTVASRLLAMTESHTSLVGQLLWLGFRRVEVPYDRVERTEGRSSWSLRRKLSYLFDSVYSFTDLPVHLITAVGVGGVLLSTGIGLSVFVAWLAGAIDVAGYTPIMLALGFLGSSVMLSLGIVGSYVWRTFENTKTRPDAVPMSAERFVAAETRDQAPASA
jgi:glycosyltransferase involved in cell wall biosynthesis